MAQSWALSVAALGLLGLGGLYYFFGAEHSEALHGFAMGGSVVALFSRVGGGIFTKSADVGADLVGKLKQVFLKMILAILRLLLITLEITLVILLEWVQISLSLTVDP